MMPIQVEKQYSSTLYWWEELCFLEGLVLVPARTMFIFAVARRGHGQDPEVILYHLASLTGAGEREFFLEGMALFWSGQHDCSQVGLCSEHFSM